MEILINKNEIVTVLIKRCFWLNDLKTEYDTEIVYRKQDGQLCSGYIHGDTKLIKPKYNTFKAI